MGAVDRVIKENIMPIYDAPRSDADRLLFLKTALDMGRKDEDAGLNYVSKETLDSAEAFIVRFEPAYLNLNAMLAQRIKETSEKTSALTELQTWVRDFWEVGKRRVYRLKLPTAVLAYYGLAQDGNVPKSAGEASWLDFAAQIVQGDADAVAAGYPAMINPSADEVADWLATAQAEAGQVGGTDRRYDQAQEDIAALRPEADTLIQDIVEQLRFSLRKKDEPSQRRIMRSYGARFTYASGETPDADEPPVETPV
jgi:hypothetical protein